MAVGIGVPGGEGFRVGFRGVAGVGFLLKMREKGKGVGRVGGVGWGGDRQRVNWQVNAQALSKLPFSKLPFSKLPFRLPQTNGSSLRMYLSWVDSINDMRSSPRRGRSLKPFQGHCLWLSSDGVAVSAIEGGCLSTVQDHKGHHIHQYPDFSWLRHSMRQLAVWLWQGLALSS